MKRAELVGVVVVEKADREGVALEALEADELLDVVERTELALSGRRGVGSGDGAPLGYSAAPPLVRIALE